MVISEIFVIWDHEISTVREAEDLGTCWNLGATWFNFFRENEDILVWRERSPLSRRR